VQTTDCILDNFISNIKNTTVSDREILVLAQTQSGKSDIIKNFSERLLDNDLKLREMNVNGIIVIICGSCNELKNDLKKKINATNTTIYHIDDIEYILKSIESEIDLKKVKLKFNNKIIIIDESHAVDQITQTRNKFFELIGLSYTKPWNSHLNVYMVHTSATSYEQIAQNMPYVVMPPRKGYYGINDIYVNKKLFQSRDLSIEKNLEYFFGKIFDCYNNNLDGYIIIRQPDSMSKKESFRSTIKKYLDDNGINFNVIDYDHSYLDNINDVLSVKPKLLTIIYLKDKMRMGITISKKYILAVHDTIKSTYTHTVVQSLLGRMTGYNANKRTLVFCDKEKAKEHLKWINKDYSIDTIPNHSKDLYDDKTIKRKNMYSLYKN